LNYNRYSNPAVDASLRKLASTSNIQAEAPLAHSVEKNVLNDSGVAWYTAFISATALDKTVQNYNIYFDQQVLLDDVWVK
jgi:hypothetical protein